MVQTSNRIKMLLQNGKCYAAMHLSSIRIIFLQGRIELLKSGAQLLYRYKDAQAAAKTKGFDLQEKLVYQIIEEAGNKGNSVIMLSQK